MAQTGFGKENYIDSSGDANFFLQNPFKVYEFWQAINSKKKGNNILYFTSAKIRRFYCILRVCSHPGIFVEITFSTNTFSLQRQPLTKNTTKECLAIIH